MEYLNNKEMKLKNAEEIQEEGKKDTQL